VTDLNTLLDVGLYTLFRLPIITTQTGLRYFTIPTLNKKDNKTQ